MLNTSHFLTTIFLTGFVTHICFCFLLQLLDLMDNLQSEESTDSKLEEKRIESLLHSSDLVYLSA